MGHIAYWLLSDQNGMRLNLVISLTNKINGLNSSTLNYICGMLFTVSLELYSMSPKDIKNSNKKHQMLEKTNKHKKNSYYTPSCGVTKIFGLFILSLIHI